MEDPEGRRKTQTKDPLGHLDRVEEESDGRALALSYTYNAAGDLTAMTDARGDVTAMTYNRLGRKKTLTDPHTGSWSYGYDPDGRLIRQKDPAGQLILYRYDALGRIIRKSTDTETLAAYRYDTASNGKGRLSEVSRGQVTDRIEGYDSMGRPTGSTRTFTNPGKSYTTRTGYDIAGRVAEMTYPDNTKIHYDYHPGTSLLKKVTGSDGIEYAAITDYGAAGEVVQIEAMEQRPAIPTIMIPCVCRGSSRRTGAGWRRTICSGGGIPTQSPGTSR